MAKRTNRLAWGLAALLVLVLLIGVGFLIAPHLVLLPQRDWGFGRKVITYSGEHGEFPPTVVGLGPFRLGVMAIRR